jgi:hypothetical protein
MQKILGSHNFVSFNHKEAELDRKIALATEGFTTNNCSEGNTQDAKFCTKCRMALTYDAYNESVEEKQQKDNDLQLVKERMASMKY